MQPTTMLMIGKASSVCLIVIATLTAAWSVAWPVSSSTPTGNSESTDEERPVAEVQTAFATSNQITLQPHWRRKLRKDAPAEQSIPEQAPEAEVKASVKLQPSVLPVRLVGTIVEGKNSFALVADETGVTDLQPAGGVLQVSPAGIRVEEITADAIIISFRGRRETIPLTSVQPGVDAEIEDNPEEQNDAPDFLETMDQLSIDEQLDMLNGDAPPPTTNSDEDGAL